MATTNRLIDLIHDQIPRRLRGRFDVVINSDPYYLHVDVIITGSDGIPHRSGPLEPALINGRLVDCKLPDWFLGHMCLIPVDNNRLAAKLWDSLELTDISISLK